MVRKIRNQPELRERSKQMFHEKFCMLGVFEGVKADLCEVAGTWDHCGFPQPCPHRAVPLDCEASGHPELIWSRFCEHNYFMFWHLSSVRNEGLGRSCRKRSRPSGATWPWEGSLAAAVAGHGGTVSNGPTLPFSNHLFCSADLEPRVYEPELAGKGKLWEQRFQQSSVTLPMPQTSFFKLSFF